MTPPRSFIFCEKRFLCGSFAVDQDLFCRTVILHEFWCENGQYRADLIRHDKFVQRAIDVTQTPYANKYKELYPLPLSVITDGKGQVKQNPGYDK